MATLDLGDCALDYDEVGRGRPLVLVHGGWLNREAWRPQVEHFADEYRVITFDVRGHGRTGPTDARRYSIDLFTDDLEYLLEHLEIERPILGGLSLGSMVAQTYVARHPDEVAAAVLGGPVRSMVPLDLPAGAKSLFTPTPALAGALALGGPESTFRSMLRSIRTTTGDPWLTTDPSVRAAAIESVRDVSSAEFRKVFDALYRFDAPRLTDCTTPVLGVYGEYEAPMLKRQTHELIEPVRDGRWAVVPDAAHLVNQDAPAAFNELVGDFLADVAGS